MSDEEASTRPAPNVVVVIMDDLGYGDLGCHGNTVVETPSIDELYGQSTRFTRFYGGPVCSPSRASLMTGRYHYRTGVTDTFKGRSMMRPDEITVAERLRAAGYRTGIFGKWHLGDNYPMRPTDQGFDEALVHHGGGLCQPAGVPDETYFDPPLWHNGERIESDGYCTDVFADAAIDFCAAETDRPFFAYVATNAPHFPLQVPEEYAEPYRREGCDEQRSRFYGMVSNIDDNVARLLGALENAGIADDTIVVFTSDHGPAQHVGFGPRYTAGLRGGKSDVYEGGIRVPFFVRWPGVVSAGEDRDELAHFVDVMPTLLDACGGSRPDDRTIDGESLLPVLSGRDGESRTLFLQNHRGDVPDLYRNCAVVEDRFKLVDGRELYDLEADPGEQRNVAAKYPDEVTRLRKAYEAWFADVTAEGFEPPRIVVGTPRENPVRLTRQEAQFEADGGSTRNDIEQCHWLLKLPESATFNVKAQFTDTDGGTAHFQFGDECRMQDVSYWQSTCTFEDVSVDAGETRLTSQIRTENEQYGVRYVEIERIDR